MKGGILLAVEYAGDRYTKDVDFSTTARVADIPPERFEATLNAALAAASETARVRTRLPSAVEGAGAARRRQAPGRRCG